MNLNKQNNKVPGIINLQVYAKDKAVIEGEILFEHLPRLHEYANPDREQQLPIQLNLHFQISDWGLPKIVGSINCELSFNCERCLLSFTTPWHINLDVHVLENEYQSQVFNKKYDYYLLDSDKMKVYEWIEEEVLLSLPLVHYHPNDQKCVPLSSKYTLNDQTNDKRQFNTFEVLRKFYQ